MIRAMFINAASGVSKKTGLPWYRISTVVMVNENFAVPFDVFLEDESVYSRVSSCKPRQNIGLKAGVNSYGKLTIVNIVTEPAPAGGGN